MKVKNITNIPQAFTLRVGTPPTRTVITVEGGDTVEVPNDIGINLCRNEGRVWVGADEESRDLVDASYPQPQPVNEVRKKVGNAKQAEKDIERGKKTITGGE